MPGKFKIITLLVVLALIAGVSTVSANGNNEAGKEGKLVTLKIMVPGDRPADFDEVIAEAEARMAQDGLNYKINMVFIPWADLGSKTQVTLAAGEQVDLIFDAPWVHMNQMVSEGYYEPLEDLINEFGPNLKKVRPELMWNANKFNDLIMGVPLGSYHKSARTYHYRSDIARELGFGKIESYDEYVEFLYAVKAQKPGMIPLSTEPNNVNHSYADMLIQYDYDLGIISTEVIPQSIVLYYQNNDGKVYNLLDKMPEEVWSYILEARKMFEDGIMNPDLMAGYTHDDLFRNGKVASIVRSDLRLDVEGLKIIQDAIPGADFDYYAPYSFEPKDNISDFKQWNFLCIPTISKQKEDAVKFLNWANGSQANYDLLAYGIEGKHWEAVGEREYKTLEPYPWFPYAWLWNPVQDRTDASLPERDKFAKKFNSEANNFTDHYYTGFTFDGSSVQNEMAVYNNLATEFLMIMNGLVDPETAWPKFKERAYEPVKTIQVELERQLADFKK